MSKSTNQWVYRFEGRVDLDDKKVYLSVKRSWVDDSFNRRREIDGDGTISYVKCESTKICRHYKRADIELVFEELAPFITICYTYDDHHEHATLYAVPIHEFTQLPLSSELCYIPAGDSRIRTLVIVLTSEYTPTELYCGYLAHGFLSWLDCHCREQYHKSNGHCPSKDVGASNFST